jgi:fluoride ion exporter CrcB/FEX
MSQAQPAQHQQQGAGLGGLLRSLVPVALAFFRAQQSGTDATSSTGQALMGALTGSQQVNPLQSGEPRAAAGGLIAQSVLRALMGGR